MFPVLFHVGSSARMGVSEKIKKIKKNRARAREKGEQEEKKKP